MNYIDQGAPPLPPREALGRRHSADTALSSAGSFSEDDDPRKIDSGQENPFNMSAAAFRAKLAVKGGKSSSLKDWRSRQDLKKMKRDGKWGTKVKHKAFNIPETATLQIRPAGASSTVSEKWQPVDKIFEAVQPAATASKANSPSVVDDSMCTSAAPSKLSSPIKETSDKKHVMRGMPPPPLPPILQPHGGPPGAPPPAPPMIKGGNMIKLKKTPNIKLKQVHWVKINGNQVSCYLKTRIYVVKKFLQIKCGIFKDYYACSFCYQILS